MNLKRTLPYLWYPGCFIAAIAGFAALLGLGTYPVLAAYLPTIGVGLVIVFLEFHFPERVEWRPRFSDIKADTAFMVVVQIVLPQALAAVSVIALASWTHARLANDAWPHHWPLWVQIAVIVLLVDFMRYWLHRACHRFIPLWRLHEVHHSPEILYILNVGRFHPLEKTLHFALDTAPFLLLGVRPEAIAGYFLMYSVNGLFQHSNVRLRYGWLNYIVGSAETHRWHHARDPKIAACNFGNTTLVWDLLFGTWRLDAKQPAVDIGITNPAYPRTFSAQMLAPFRDIAPPAASEENPAAWRSMLRRFSFWAGLLMHRRQVGALVRDPMRAQQKLLRRILRENRHTAFGRQHAFDCIRRYADFSQRVPVREYEALRPFIAAEIERGENALTAHPPRHYVRTSGTTGLPKDVPLTDSHLRALRQIQRRSILFQHRACPDAFAGGLLGIVGAAAEGVLTNGKPYGSASGIVVNDTPKWMQRQFVVPPEVFGISDSRLKYLLILRLSLARRDLSYIGSANPSTLLALMKLYREHRGTLIADVRNGTFFLAEALTTEIKGAVRTRLAANPTRAHELENLSAADARLAHLWPHLRAVVTWTCASAGITVDVLRRELSPRTRILELGYIASEFRGTLTLGRRADSGLPTVETHFFEFVERDRWESGEPEFLTLDQVRKNIPYYVVVTTPSGLYRYFINDLVVVRGFLNKMPLLKFLQKGRGVTNITGEKLYETQVLAAVKTTMSRSGLGVRFVMMLADEVASRYLLYIEPDAGPRPTAEQLAASVDLELKRSNLEYAAKRESSRLQPPIAAWLLPETGEAYKQHCLQQGQREGQFKIVALAYRNRFGFDLEPFVEGRCA